MQTLEIQVLDSYNKDILCDYYEIMKEKSLLSAFLYEDTSLQTFIDFCYKQWIYICLLNGKCVGFTVFNDFKGRSAFFHFCMFKEGIVYTLDFGNMIFETVFRNKDLERIFGLTPKVYRHVFPVLKSIGMKELCTIKEACMVKSKPRDGVVSTISRDEFYTLKQNKKEV